MNETRAKFDNKQVITSVFVCIFLFINFFFLFIKLLSLFYTLYTSPLLWLLFSPLINSLFKRLNFFVFISVTCSSISRSTLCNRFSCCCCFRWSWYGRFSRLCNNGWWFGCWQFRSLFRLCRVVVSGGIGLEGDIYNLIIQILSCK